MITTEYHVTVVYLSCNINVEMTVNPNCRSRLSEECVRRHTHTHTHKSKTVGLKYLSTGIGIKMRRFSFCSMQGV